MKKIIWIIIPLLVLCFASCDGDLKIQVDPLKCAPSQWVLDRGSIFPSHGDTFTLGKDDAELLFDTLKWTPAQFGYSAAVSYAIQMAVDKGDGTPVYKMVATTSQPFYRMTVKELNSCILNSGAIKRQESRILIRISASISTNYAAQVSEPYGFTVTTFSTDPDLLYFVSAGAEVADPEYIFAPSWNGAYDGYAYIPYGAEGIWLVEEIAPDVKWGIANSTAQGGTLTLTKESEGGQPIRPGAFGTGNVEASFTADGYYRASVKIQAATKSIQLWRFYGKFFVAGQRNMNYIWWGQSMSNQDPGKASGTGALLTYYPQERVWKSEVVYVPKYQTADVPPPAPENTSIFQFKFRANWGSSWGNAANLGGTADAVSSETGIQVGRVTVGGGNINFNATAGNYYWKVYLNEYPYRYELIPANE